MIGETKELCKLESCAFLRIGMKHPETAIGRTFIEWGTEFLWQKIHCEIQSEILDEGRERDKKGMKKMQMTYNNSKHVMCGKRNEMQQNYCIFWIGNFTLFCYFNLLVMLLSETILNEYIFYICGIEYI